MLQKIELFNIYYRVYAYIVLNHTSTNMMFPRDVFNIILIYISPKQLFATKYNIPSKCKYDAFKHEPLTINEIKLFPPIIITGLHIIATQQMDLNIPLQNILRINITNLSDNIFININEILKLLNNCPNIISVILHGISQSPYVPPSEYYLIDQFEHNQHIILKKLTKIKITSFHSVYDVASLLSQISIPKYVTLNCCPVNHIIFDILSTQNISALKYLKMNRCSIYTSDYMIFNCESLQLSPPLNMLQLLPYYP